METGKKSVVVGAEEAWLALLFGEDARDFEYFGSVINGKVFSHPKLRKVHFGAEFVYSFDNSGINTKFGELLQDVGFETWRYTAFQQGFEGRGAPPFWYFRRGHFYNKGVRERRRYQQTC